MIKKNHNKLARKKTDFQKNRIISHNQTGCIITFNIYTES
jgi:hypothetical protein